MSKEKPDFLRPDLSLKPLGEGGLVDAFSVEPGNTGASSVIKVYRLEDLEHLRSGSHDTKDVDIHEYIKILKERQNTITALYPKLSDLVVPVQFFVANNSDGQPAIHVLQQKIDGPLEARDEYYGFGEFRAQIKALSPDKQKEVVKDLKYFRDRTEEISAHQDLPEGYLEYGHQVKMPDIIHGNLRVDREGKLRLIDTNMFIDLNSEDDSENDDYREFLINLENLIEELRK